MKSAFVLPFFQTSSSLTFSRINPSLPEVFMPLPCFLGPLSRRKVALTHGNSWTPIDSTGWIVIK